MLRLKATLLSDLIDYFFMGHTNMFKTDKVRKKALFPLAYAVRLAWISCIFWAMSLAKGEERIWSLEVDEASQTAILKKDEVAKEWMMADRDWETFKRANKPFQCDLPKGPILKKGDIRVFALPFRLRDLFMIPMIQKGSVTSWKLVNREGYHTGTINVLLGSSPQYLRRYLRTSYQMSCSRALNKSWVIDKTTEEGIWYMRYIRINQSSIFIALLGNLAITVDVVNDGEQIRFNVEDVRELFQLLLGEKKYEFPGDDLKLALEKDKKRAIARELDVALEGKGSSLSSKSY